MKMMDSIGLVVSLGLFLFSMIGIAVGWYNHYEDYEYMLFPLIISLWGIWGAWSLLRKKQGSGDGGS